jgi:hypothetical protein
MNNQTITLTWFDDAEDEITHSFPSIKEVCGRCEGHGTHLTPSIGEHAYSSEEFYESFCEPEDRAEYFKRGGIYDVTCDLCHGANVVAVVDEAHLSEADKEKFLSYEKCERLQAQYDADDAATYRMESGYRE